MKIAPLQFGCLGLALAVALAAPWETWREGERHLKLMRDDARRRTENLAALQEEHARLSKLVAKAGPDRLSNEQLRELLRLRDQVGRLREAGREIDTLHVLGASDELRLSKRPGGINGTQPPEQAREPAVDRR